MNSSKSSPLSTIQLAFGCGLILTIGLTMRLGLLWASPDRGWPHSVYYEGDAPLWVRYAEALRRGEAFEYDLPLHGPGMAYLLKWTMGSGGGGSFVGQKVALSLVGSAACAGCLLLGNRLFGGRVGLWAGLLSSLSFGLVVQSTSLNNETLYLASLLLIVWVFSPRGAPSYRRVGLLGMLNGLAALVRPEHTLLFVMLLVLLLARERRRDGGGWGRALKLAGVQSLVFFLVPLPWNVRSYRAIQRFNEVEARAIDYDIAAAPWTAEARERLESLPAFCRAGNFAVVNEWARRRGLQRIEGASVNEFFEKEFGYTPRPLSPWVFVSNQGALSFALANFPGADGGFSTKRLDDRSATGVFSFAHPGHLRLFQEGYSIGLRFWREQPGEAMRLLGRKLDRFLGGWCTGFTLWNVPPGEAGARSPVDQLSARLTDCKAWAACLLLLAAIGAVRARRSPGLAIILVVLGYKLLICAAYYGYARQAVSVLPFAYLLVAGGLESLLVGPVMRRWPGLGSRPAWAVVALLIVVCGLTAASVWRPWTYDVEGPADAAPRWGHGAFESHQLLRVGRL